MQNSDLMSAEIAIRQHKSTRNMNSTIAQLKNIKLNGHFYLVIVYMCHLVDEMNYRMSKIDIVKSK